MFFPRCSVPAILCCLLSGLFFTIPASANSKSAEITIKILGINDFHGQITSGRVANNKPVGGAAVLDAYLKQAQKGMDDRTVITFMGDLVGASTPASGLLHDEPSILFANTLGNSYCQTKTRLDPRCNVVATPGNHEFDRGQKAMFDLIYGTSAAPTNHWIDLPNYPGAAFPYVSANIAEEASGKLLFPPYTIQKIHGIPIAFIGAVIKTAASSMTPESAQGIQFLDEATSINRYVPEIKAKGAKIIVVLIHEGGNQTPYEGDTQHNTRVSGGINSIVNQLDDNIDVVMAGHTHQFINAYIPNQHGIKMLVTQAYSYSAAFTEVTLKVNPVDNTVIGKSARIITTYADEGAGKNPVQATRKLVELAETAVEPIVNQYIGTAQNNLLRKTNIHGESNIGNLIADAYRTVMQTEIGLVNSSGIRNDISAGTTTWGTVYSVLPFDNKTVILTLTGQDIYDLLEQQWSGSYARILQISGIAYTYDKQKPVGQRILAVTLQNKPLNKVRKYTIATNDFLAHATSSFPAMEKAEILSLGQNDRDTLIDYIKQLPQPYSAQIENRITCHQCR